MEISHLLIMFFVGVVASAFGTLIGGSSIVTIPTLILLGLPPHTAIGTDRFGIIGVGMAGLHARHVLHERVIMLGDHDVYAAEPGPIFPLPYLQVGAPIASLPAQHVSQLLQRPGRAAQ